MEACASQHAVVAGVLDMIEAKARAYGSLAGMRYGEPSVRSSYMPRLIRDPGALIDSTA